MAGKGPAPKRGPKVRHDPHASVRLEFVGAEQPDLPPGIDWHLQTRAWWKTWAESEQAALLTATDWCFLLDTALMHHAMWSRGQWTLAAEVRLRVAKFGATPEDRQRLRWLFADDDGPVEVPAGVADVADGSSGGSPRPAGPESAAGRYAGLRVVSGSAAAEG